MISPRICCTIIVRIRARYLVRDGRPTRPMAALPRPEETEPAPMPSNDGFGFDDDERRPSVTPDSGEPDPEQPIEACQSKSTRMRSFRYVKLVPKARTSSCKPTRERAPLERQQGGDEDRHRSEGYSSSAATATIPTRSGFW